MRKKHLFAFVFLTLVYSCGRTPEAHLQKIGTGFAATSVNTCVFRGSSITSDSAMRLAGYYDADSLLTLAVQERGSDRWETVHTRFKGRVNDAHNIISVALDGEGYIHLCWNQHASRMQYTRSLEPYKAVFPEPSGMTGTLEDNVTYPEFHRLSCGDLLFFYRDGSSGRGNLVLNRYSVADKTWSRVQDVLIDGEGERNAYPQMYVDAKDNIHLSWVWRETYNVETNHDMCYAFSSDGGVTWRRTDGSEYEIPVTAASAEYAWRIPQGSELINQTSMTADADGHPYIATYWRDKGSDVPQYRIVWHDGREWRSRTVGHRTLPFSLSGAGTKAIPISRPQLAMTPHGPVFIFRDEERGSLVSAFTAKDLDGEWKVTDLTDFSVNLWEPSLDYEALKREGELCVFVQNSGQGDGEQLSDFPPQPVYVMDVRMGS